MGSPHWPHGFANWYDWGLFVMLCLFKLDRARLMLKRSGYVDLLGASFIASDFAIGVAYGFGAAFILFPPLLLDGWLRWGIRSVLALVLGTAWVLMRLAKPARVQSVTGDGAPSDEMAVVG